MRKVLLSLALVLLIAYPSFAAKHVLKLGHIADPANPYAMGGEHFAKLVGERTNGEIEIQVFPLSQLGNQRDLVEGVIYGTVDLTLTYGGMLANFLPEVVVFELPFIYKDIPHAYEAWDTLGHEIGAKGEPRGFKILAFFENGLRHTTNNVRPIRKPADYKGLKIRVPEGIIGIETMKALGASPTPMPFSDVYSAMQQGVIDGHENPVTHIWTNRFYEVQKYVSKTGHGFGPEPLLVSMATWNKLTPEQQKLVQECADEAKAWQRELCRKLEMEYWGKLAGTSMEINEVSDPEEFRKIAQVVWKALEARAGKENIQRIMNMRK